MKLLFVLFNVLGLIAAIHLYTMSSKAVDRKMSLVQTECTKMTFGEEQYWKCRDETIRKLIKTF
jgi:hypothetical protein